MPKSIVKEAPFSDDEYWVMALGIACNISLDRSSKHHRRVPLFAKLARMAAGEYDQELRDLMEIMREDKSRNTRRS